MRFSDEQEAAINAKGENYLISAGAGSGKTAVLTERIYRIAKENDTLDNFLVLTFTNLAAAEMKTRVRGKLIDDDATKHLASEVDNAHIETFDSFYLFLAKKYFYKLGISKDLNIVDSSILSIKKADILDEVFNELCEQKDEGFVDLIASYCVKNVDIIKDFIIRVLAAADRNGDKYGYLESLRDDFYNDDIINVAINDLFNEIKTNIAFLREEAYKLQNSDDATRIIDLLNELDNASDYDSLYLLIKNSKFPRKPSKSEFDDGELRTSISKMYKSKISDNDYGTSEEIRELYLESYSKVKTIINIAIEIEKRTDAFKLEYNAFSFPDISRFVLKLLSDEDIRKEISDSFDYIMIDEYQDTNLIQDTVIKAIAKNNVYMVGDVKQSIYKFRGADCQIFQDKYEKYKKGKGGKEIDLNRSYRSRKEVVDFVNELFSILMTKDLNPIDYSNGHHFGFGRTEYEDRKSSCNYQPEVYNYTYEKSAETAYIESEIIAKDILTRINQKYQVFDKENGSKDCSFKDFAIIIDRGKDFGIYRRVFSEYNIPLKVESKETLFKSDIVYVLRNLIKLVYYSLNSDYGTGYKHSFFSVARSFLYEYDDATLYEIAKEDKYLLEGFAQEIELMKESLRFASIKTIIQTLVDKFDIYASLSKITSFYANAHKIENIISLAESFDVLGYTLEEFVKYFGDLQSQDIDIEYRDSDAQENSVTLLNIHASKGLEYGIIYYPGLIKKFNEEELKSSFLVSNKYGMVIPSTSEKNLSSPFIHLIKEEIKRSDFEEKIRLIYVAFTRAKEKIIILNGSKENDGGLIKPTDSSSFKQMLSFTNILNKYRSDYSFNVKPIENENEKVVDKITIKSIEVPYKVIERKRASKEVDEEIDESVLEFGTTIHAYLEHMDLENDDLSYIKDNKIRKYVKNVKESWLLKGVNNEDVRHEFPFIDEEKGITGYIDLLILRDEEVDIVDFKLKNIDEIEYDKQLRTYKNFIKSITPKKVRMFLLAAITGEIREVEDESETN